MSTAYHVETIERITEQMIEEEISNDVEQIRTDADKKINAIRDEAVKTIKATKDENSTYTAAEKRDMILKFGDMREQLNQIDSDTDAIYQKIVPIASNKEAEIENDIRTMIVNNGFSIDISNDGKGNITAKMRRDG